MAIALNLAEVINNIANSQRITTNDSRSSTEFETESFNAIMLQQPHWKLCQKYVDAIEQNAFDE